MPYKLPNSVDAPYFDQSEPDAGDFAALGERNTGVLTGGVVTAQGTPALAVDYTALTYVINGTPYSKTSGTVTIIAGEANARFDLVVGDTTGAVVVLKGTASTNPSFPTLDPTLYCFLASVYVRQSVTAIGVTDIVDKRVTAPSSFRRVYADSVTTAISFTDSAPKTTTMRSDGQISWVSSVLRRTADAAMEFATSLVVKAADTALPLLVLKARASTPASQHVLEVQPSASTTPNAFISGTGRGVFDNFKEGNGSPEGVVVGSRGDIYRCLDFSDVNAALWIKSDDGDNTGWKPLQVHDTTASSLPVGTIIALPVAASYSLAGYGFCGGALVSATDPTYLALYGVYGTRFGGTPGVNFNFPDYRGYSLIGAAGQRNVAVGTADGHATGLIVMTERQLAVHRHSLNDPGHYHHLYGRPYIYRPPNLPPTSLRPMFSDSPLVNVPNMPYMDIMPIGFESTQGVAETDITMNDAGFGDSIDIMGPVHGVSFFAKL